MAEINKEEFPSNSHKRMELATAPKRVEKIVSGKVIKRRKSVGNSITETLFGNDAKSVLSYVLQDVLIPAAKNTIQEMVSGGIEMLLFGENGSRDRRRFSYRSPSKTVINYGNFSNVRSTRESSGPIIRSLSRQKYEDVVLEDRGEAEDVVDNLIELIEKYGQATLADFYELVDVDSDFSDNKYGWTNLSKAQVNRVREGYIISFPRPRPLED